MIEIIYGFIIIVICLITLAGVFYLIGALTMRIIEKEWNWDSINIMVGLAVVMLLMFFVVLIVIMYNLGLEFSNCRS